MDVVSGVASITQIIAYTHSTSKVLIQLYKLARGDPSIFQDHVFSVKVLLSIVESLHQRVVPDHIIAVLVEIADLAQAAQNIIIQSQTRGFLGVRWTCLYRFSDLSMVFASLREKREILHLALTANATDMTGPEDLNAHCGTKIRNLVSPDPSQMGINMFIDRKSSGAKYRSDPAETTTSMTSEMVTRIQVGSISSSPAEETMS